MYTFAGPDSKCSEGGIYYWYILWSCKYKLASLSYTLVLILMHCHAFRNVLYYIAHRQKRILITHYYVYAAAGEGLIEVWRQGSHLEQQAKSTRNFLPVVLSGNLVARLQSGPHLQL